VPFTASHPAAVIPFFGTRLVPSALVIGSMIPDLPYYLPLRISSVVTHSGVGIVTVDIALGALVFVLWVAWIAPAAVALSPASLRDRLAPSLPVAPAHHARSVPAALLVLGSLAIGAFTHVAWDAFTHPGRWGTRHIAWLAAEHGPLAGYRWLQYASGIVGAAVIAGAAVAWWRRTPRSPGQRIPARGRRATVRAAATVVACTIVGSVAGLAAGIGDGLRHTGFLVVTWGLGAGSVAILAIAISMRRGTQP
jgi:hypothetical protein